MKRVLFLAIIAVLMCSVGVSAQRISLMKNSLAQSSAAGASITVTEDDGVKQAVALIESKTGTPSKVSGYRFVIFHDSEQFANERASRALAGFRSMYKSVSSYLSVESPTFRVIIGDCFNYEEVAILRNKIDNVYPDAALCEADIPLRLMLRYQGQNNMLVERNGVVSGGVELSEATFGEENNTDGAVIETPDELANGIVEGEVIVAIKRPNTEILDEEGAPAEGIVAESVEVIETPVAVEAAESQE